MEICSCGHVTDDKKPQCPRCEALNILGLGTDALENEIRSAYRLLSKTWSPENFADDPKLKEAAEGRLQDIHTAFIFLTPISTEIGRQQRPIYLSSGKALPNAPNAEATPATVSTNLATPGAAANTNPSSGLWRKIYAYYKKFRLVLRIAAIVFVLFTGRSLWTVLKEHNLKNEQVATVNSTGNDAPAAAKKSFWDALFDELKKLDPRNPEPEPDQQAAPQNAKIQKPAKAPSATPKAQPATEIHKVEPYLTIGSTREEVLAQQGPPTSSSEDKLVYGKSELYLKDGAVVGWRIDPDSSPIRVKLWPHSSVDPDQKAYAVGSSKDEVLVIQGTPTAFTEDTFEYGRSIVYFQNNRVIRWKEDPASVVLWAK